MCITCRQKMSISYLINQLKNLETEVDDSYDFSRWNTTSLSFLYLDLLDERIKDYHYIIENVCQKINADKKNILDSIGNKNGESSELFNLMEQQIIKNKQKLSFFWW